MRSLIVPSILLISACVAHASSIYHVGNSLTNDALGYRYFLDAAGTSYNYGYHIRSGQSLPSIAGSPDSADLFDPAYGTLGAALDGFTWDAVTFQPFYGSTLAQDQAVINGFISQTLNRPANANFQPYIYAAYPGRPDIGTYADAWLQPATNDDSQGTILSRQYFERLLTRVRASQPDVAKTTLLIPVGEVLYQVEQKILNGQIDGLDSAIDLYRDPVHLNNVGWYAASATFYAVLYQADPRGLSVDLSHFPDDWGPEYIPWNADITTEINDTVWSVVNSMPAATGVPEPSILAPGIVAIAMLLRRR
jgi:hypothetical protein